MSRRLFHAGRLVRPATTAGAWWLERQRSGAVWVLGREASGRAVLVAACETEDDARWIVGVRARLAGGAR